MNITPKFVNPAASGKKYGSIVDANDKRYPCPAELVGKFLKGKSYEIAVEQAEWGGKYVDVIRDVKLIEAPASTPAQPAAGHTQLTDAELRFVSNVVGQAILAKTIVDPLTIGQWAKAARQTLKELG